MDNFKHSLQFMKNEIRAKITESYKIYGEKTGRGIPPVTNITFNLKGNSAGQLNTRYFMGRK